MYKKDFSNNFSVTRHPFISFPMKAVELKLYQPSLTKTKLNCSLILGLLLTPNFSYAQELVNESELFEIVQVTGSRLSKLFSGNNELLEVSEQTANIEELLQSSRMLEVNSNAGAGSFNDIYLRGADPNLTLTLFNGVPLNDSSNSRGGSADVSAIDPWFLTSAEIVAGARSAIYGSQAVAGAINLLSKPDSSGTTIKASVSSNSGHYSGIKYASDDFLLGLSQSDSAQAVVGSSQDSVNTILQWQPKHENTYFDLFVWANHSKATSFPDDSGGGRYAINRELEHKDTDDVLASLKMNHSLDYGLLSAQLSVRKKDESVDTPAVVPGIRNPQGLPAISSDNELTNQHLALSFSRSSDKIDWLVGTEYQREKSDVTGILDFSFFTLPSDFLLERETFSAFAELQTELAPSVLLALSGRYDKVETTDRLSPNINLVWQLDEEQQVYFDWGDSFKLPSMYALSNPLVGNPELANETAITREIGYQFNGEHVEWGTAVFNNHFSNLVDFEPGPPPRLVNRNKVTAKGIELWFSYVSDSWSTEASYRYSDIKRDQDFELLGRSKNRYQFAFNKQFSGILSQLHASLTVRLQSSVLASSIPTGELRLDGYNDVKLNLDYQISSALKTSLSVRNLLQDDIQVTPGNIQDQSIWRLSLSYKL